MTANRPYIERARQVIAGGALGMLSLPSSICPVITRGVGAKAYDSEGREYIDLIMSAGAAILGHAHPTIVAAVKDQADRGAGYFLLNAPAIEFAERIVNAVPCAEAMRFQQSGSDAVYAAIRLARGFTGRTRILKFEGAWHGGTDFGQLSGAPTGPSKVPLAVPDCDGILAKEFLWSRET
ncbi:MAG: aminotransferase class III-fold pyridoxal phosphate-dependent enzyme [Proteobacteria bacterium]|nr:aminotransferase class III-fold pyridoxal phosphate-dependent enzyme [Pseudomonadota bacterium]